MSKNSPSRFSGETRAIDGLIVSCRNPRGVRRTTHTPGSPGPVLRRVCAEIDGWEDGPWEICAISSPETVLRDVTGRITGPSTGPLPESRLLARVKRLDLLPRAWRGDKAEKSIKRSAA